MKHHSFQDKKNPDLKWPSKIPSHARSLVPRAASCVTANST
jgi:hypothetical protein